mgnify:CR=1 FL=1
MLQNQIQGYWAEVFLSARLAGCRDWWVMRDVLVPSKQHTSQIDLIIISNYCVFVGEVKSFHGLIVGTGNKSYWRQYVGRWEKDYYNPVFQNQSHIQSLKHFLRNVQIPLHFHSLIVMQGMDKAKLSISPPYLPNTSIITSVEALFRVTQSVCEKKYMDISSEQSRFLFDYIGENQIHGAAARMEHAQYAYAYKQSVEESIANHICPKCHFPWRILRF